MVASFVLVGEISGLEDERLDDSFNYPYMKTVYMIK